MPRATISGPARTALAGIAITGHRYSDRNLHGIDNAEIIETVVQVNALLRR